jgi:hypothetical protein
VLKAGTLMRIAAVIVATECPDPPLSRRSSDEWATMILQIDD